MPLTPPVRRIPPAPAPPRSLPAIAALAALLLGACSPIADAGTLQTPGRVPTIAGPAAEPAPPPAPTRPPAHPTFEVPGAGELGFTEPGRLLRLAEPWGIDGTGYLTLTDGGDAGVVELARLAWSGEELWRREVPRPDGADDSVQAWLSLDRGLGVVAVWYTGDTQDPNNLSEERAVVGDISWFHRDSGELGGVLETSAVGGGVVRANAMVVGYDLHEVVDGVPAEDAAWSRHLGADLTLEQLPHDPLSDLALSWNGSILVHRDLPEPGVLFIEGGMLLMEMQAGEGYSFYTTPEVLHLTSSLGELVLQDTQGRMTSVTDPCVGELPNVVVARDQVAAGGMLVSLATLEGHCVEDLPDGHQISAVGPDGWLFSQPFPKEAGDRYARPESVWLGREGGQWRPTGLADSPMFTDGHVLFFLDDGEAPGARIVVYPLADFAPER